MIKIDLMENGGNKISITCSKRRSLLFYSNWQFFFVIPEVPTVVLTQEGAINAEMYKNVYMKFIDLLLCVCFISYCRQVGKNWTSSEHSK